MKKSFWVVSCLSELLFIIIFILVFLGALLDIKCDFEVVSEVSDDLIKIAYYHVYILSIMLIIQFLFAVYLLIRVKKYVE